MRTLVKSFCFLNKSTLKVNDNTMKKNSRLVYSTDKGRIKTTDTEPQTPAGDGIVRIRRETSGRKGNAVTTISGVALPAAELKVLAKKLTNMLK